MIKHNKQKNSSAGFTLVEILIGVGLIAFISAAMASMFISQLQSQNRLAQKYEILSLRDSISLSLADPAVCKCQLDTMTFSATNITGQPSKLQVSCDANSPVLVEAAKKVPGTQTNLEVTTVDFAPDGPVVLGSRVKLNIIVNFKADQKMGSFRPISIPKVITISGTGAITGCEADAANMASVCATLAGTYDPINQKCTLPLANFNCRGSNQAITGFRSTGEPICQTVASTTIVNAAPTTTTTTTGGTTTGGTTTTSSSSPSGTVVGGGTCTPYTYASRPGCEGSCGNPGDSVCPSTWSYSGVGMSGGCASGYNYQDTSVGGGGTLGFICTVP